MSNGEEKTVPNVEKTEEEALAEGVSLLLPIDVLLSAGIHIGTRIKTSDMEPFIYRIRPDGLYVLDVKKTDERIKIAAKFIAQFNPSEVVVISARLYGKTPVKKFCETVGTRSIIGRFMPGVFSNPAYPTYIEPQVIMVTDPKADRQAVKEGILVGKPIVAICDTENDFSGVDYVIPANNKGRRALATVYWLLARQILRERGELQQDANITATIDDFETKLADVGVTAEPDME